jgi:hypothetical protein
MLSTRPSWTARVRGNDLLIRALAGLVLLVFTSTVARAQNTTYDYPVIITGGADINAGSEFGFLSLSTDILNINGFQIDNEGNMWATGVLPPYGDDLWIGNIDNLGDVSIGSDLTTNGTFIFNSSMMNLGSWTDAASTAWNGTVWSASNNSSVGNIDMMGNSPKVHWTWWQNAAANSTEQMSLNEHGNLTLTDATSGSNLTISPVTFAISANWQNGTHSGNATVPFSSLGGTVTTLPDSGNLCLNSGNIVLNSRIPSLTLGSGSGYFNVSGDTVSGDGTLLDAGGSDEFDWGYSVSNHPFYISENGTASFMWVGASLGSNSTNYYSSYPLSVGDDTPQDSNTYVSVVLSGGQACEDSSPSLVMGKNTVAYCDNSSAIGGGDASNSNSIAIGNGTVTNTDSQVVVGHYNQSVSGSPPFVVGAGNSSVASNGLVVFGNATTTFNGTATVTRQLSVGNTSLFNGNVSLGGNITMNSPQGDIPMGMFGNP